MKTLKSSEGFALFIAILVMAIVMLFVGASMLLSRVDTKITSNFKLGTQALEVADAGLQHALAEIPKGYDFNLICEGNPPPCDLLSDISFPSAPGFSYTVTVESNSPELVLISTANGPNDTKRQVQAYVNRSSVDFTSPGALYLPASSVDVDFNKANNPGMFITGDDTSYTDSDSDGWADSTSAGPATAVKGVTVKNNALKDNFISALGISNLDLVQGKGYSADPLTPSVFTTKDNIDANQIALNFFNNAGTVKDLDGEHKTCSSSSPCVYGTDASPQITYIREGADHIHLDGYVTGSGVLVIEGKTHLYGNFNFHGVVVSVKLGLTGGTDPGTLPADYFSLRNNAKIFGGVLLGPTNGDQAFQIQDDAKIYYNSDAITMANSLCGDCFPQPPKVFAWIDK
ncbi:MAG: pilus assembly PilX N-terminal domain-containing protein [Deltaproteobacteria bacterium]|nr:pilus assembly PilX N-terminal domain-containing protein [Deltaproteobacteria bacterium]